MHVAHWAVFLTLFLFVAILACLEAGYRIAGAHAKHSAEFTHEGVGVIEAAVFALLGLLLAFSMAGGMSRLDSRRAQIVEEANAVGTAYLRLDLLPSDQQPPMRQLFRQYLDARLRVYADTAQAGRNAALARANALQHEIWSRAVQASQADPSQDIGRLLLPALNQMIDITTTRLVASRIHLPTLIFALLGCVALLSGLLAGYALAKRRSRSWLHMILYAAIVAATIYTVVDLDYPRTGFIQLNIADQALKDLRDSIR